MKVVGLFAGIGGIELGLRAHGFESVLMCDIDPSAQRVLASRFPEANLKADIRQIATLPQADILTAGFPCQDLSQAGKKAGIAGTRSSLVSEVFRLCEAAKKKPEWILFENVSYMLRLGGGLGMGYLISSIEELGYRWAYRVVDTRSFGIPQRRQRVMLLASRTNLPEEVLFADDSGELLPRQGMGPVNLNKRYGFYWTEGLRGIGWTEDAVPTIKGGSTIGIPSPPAVWFPRRRFIGTIHIEDAERLQGFRSGWTLPAVDGNRTAAKGPRWRLVGNAVCVPMARWVGSRLMNPRPVKVESALVEGLRRWPIAAWGGSGRVYQAHASLKPLKKIMPSIQDFVRHEFTPLSEKATAGFLDRARRSPNLAYPDRFLADVEHHLASMA